MADVPSPPSDVVLEARAVRKTFDGVTALAGVDITLHAGQIHGLIGQNGAGKSTLVKILNGVHAPDDGTILVAGEPVVLRSPVDAQAHGIGMVFQEFSLVPTLTVAQNIVLAREPRRRLGLLDHSAAIAETTRRLADLGVDIPPTSVLSDLAVGGQQLVEIAKALARAPSILILDEPTASLSHSEIETLFGVLRRLRDRGVAIVYISHHLNEVVSICDEITVLRDGRVTLSGRRDEHTVDEIVMSMTGSHSTAHRVEERAALRDEDWLLDVRGLRVGNRLDGIDLRLRSGEVLGIVGLLGSGRTSLLRSLMGLEPAAAGTVAVLGRDVTLDSPGVAKRLGLAYVPEDRRREGIIEGQSVRSNVLLSIWDRLTRMGLISEQRAHAVVQRIIDRLAIRASSPDQPIQTLSGGNQQKVVVGRAMALEPRILLLDDPTAGIDIGSRRELLGHVRRFADAGNGAILASSELDEVGGICDRIAILRRGRIVRVLDRAAGDQLEESALLQAIHSDPEGTVLTAAEA